MMKLRLASSCPETCSTTYRMFDKILVATDHSICADAALAHAMSMAGSFGSEIHVLHVVESNRSAQNQAIHWPFSDPGSGTIADRTVFEQRWGLSTSEVGIIPVIRENRDAAQAILDYRREHKIDLILIGTHGRDSVRRFLLDSPNRWSRGETASRLVPDAPCHVMMIGPKSFLREIRLERVLTPEVDHGDCQPLADFSAQLARSLNIELETIKPGKKPDALTPNDLIVISGSDSSCGDNSSILSSAPCPVLIASHDVFAEHRRRGVENRRSHTTSMDAA